MESALIPSSGQSATQIRENWKALCLSSEDYEQLLGAFLGSEGSGEAALSDLYAYAGLYTSDMKERLEKAGCPQEGLLVMDHVQNWKPVALRLVHEMLLHAVSNAMDHGFIRPLQKKENVRPALIRIEALPKGPLIQLKVTDNGAEGAPPNSSID